jgi:hypothetical protein
MRIVIETVKNAMSWAWRHKARTFVLLLVLFLAQPKQVRSQLDACCEVAATGLSAIGNTLNTVIGGPLKDIASVEQTISNFEQKVVWPEKLINQARSLVASVQGLFNQIEGIMRVPVNSATLPATQQFEQNLLSRDPNQILQMSAQYSAVYGALPAVVGASPQVRDMTDMTDATAQAAMKRAIQIDALADLELQAADQLHQNIQTAAPGSAPIIEAEADAWLVRANAYTQSATADLMRVRAIDLANASANVKNGAANAAALQQQIYNLLKRQ